MPFDHCHHQRRQTIVGYYVETIGGEVTVGGEVFQGFYSKKRLQFTIQKIWGGI